MTSSYVSDGGDGDDDGDDDEGSVKIHHGEIIGMTIKTALVPIV